MSKIHTIKTFAKSKVGVAAITGTVVLGLTGGGLGVAASNGTLEDIVNQISGRVEQTEVKTEELDTRVTVLETEAQEVREPTPKKEESADPEPAPEPVEPEPTPISTPTPQPEPTPTQPAPEPKPKPKPKPAPEPKPEPEPMPEPAYTNADLIALARQHAKQGDAIIDFEDEISISVRYNEQRKRIIYNNTANGGQGGWFWGHLNSDLGGVNWSKPMPHSEAVVFLTSI